MSFIMSEHPVPGALATWVSDQNVVFHQALGLADLESLRTIQSDKTLFRVGSISKVFTAIGALRLVEQGLLDLDTDIHHYLQERLIDDLFDSPVTLRHLLTHTAGFDDRHIGKSVRNREEVPPFSEVMSSMLPARFIDSGEIASYSNFGVALAGYLIEVASGRPFADYMYEEVFAPLGMVRTTFDPDESLAGEMMTGYFHRFGMAQPLTLDYLLDAPAGQMVSTGADMIMFMKAVLSGHGLEEAGVLSREMTDVMMSLQFRHHPRHDNGYGFLWNISEYGGHRFVGHDGGYIGVAARLMFFPEHDAGLFVVANSMDFGFIARVTDLLIDSYLESPDFEEKRARDMPLSRYEDDRSLSDFTGTWRDTRYSRASMTKMAVLAGLMGNEMTTAVEEDTLLTMPMLHGGTRRLVQTEPLLFESLDDDYFLAFREESGCITHVFTSGNTALERIGPLESRMLHVVLLFTAFLLFGVITFFYPVAFFLRWLQGLKPVVTTISSGEWVISGLYTLGLLGSVLAVYHSGVHQVITGFGYGVPRVFYITFLLPWIALIYTLLHLIQLINGYRSGSLSRFRTTGSALIVLFSMVTFLSLFYWNLVGWRF